LLTFYAIHYVAIGVAIGLPLPMMMALDQLASYPTQVGIVECWAHSFTSTPIGEVFPCVLGTLGGAVASSLASVGAIRTRAITIGDLFSVAGLVACYLALFVVGWLVILRLLTRLDRWWPWCKPRKGLADVGPP
jgi:hypothetical protein